MSRVRWKGAFFTLPVLAVALATSAAAQATGTIEGKVTETGSGRPLSGAQIFIAGTTVGGVTNDRGEYRIVRVRNRPNAGVVDWLLACPEKGYFVPIESESTDTL